MIPPTPPVTGLAPAGTVIQGQNPNGAVGASTASNFSELVSDFVSRTNLDQQVSGEAMENLALGRADNVQDVVLAVANAEMSFQLFVEIRNKVIDAWNQLMQMQF